MNFSKIKTLVLYAQYTDRISYYDDWLDAFLKSHEFNADALNIHEGQNISFLKKNVSLYDFIVLLHSVTAMRKNLTPLKIILGQRKGKLLTFVCDELNLPLFPLSEKIQFIKDIEADFIGTQLPLDAGKWLYEECRRSSVAALPHALNPEVFKSVIPQEGRPVDMGSRSVKYNVYLGDNDRERLFDYFLKNKFNPPLICDIETDTSVHSKRRFPPGAWNYFLNGCKGTLSTEAGTYYLEKDDRTVKAVFQYLKEKQRTKGERLIPLRSPLRSVWLSSPSFMRKRVWENMDIVKKVLGAFRVKVESDVEYDGSYEEVYEKFFKNYPPPPFTGKAISSRHFDAVGAKTCQIMFKGRFNDILNAGEHYIAVEKDFSNVNEVLERFRDVSYRKNMVERTYEYVMNNHTLSHRIKFIRGLLH